MRKGKYLQIGKRPRTRKGEADTNENNYEITELAAKKGPRELQLSGVKDKSLK